MAPLVPFRTHTPAPTAPPSTPLVHTFYHDPTATWTYVLVCPRTRACAIVDSALDYDPSTQRISTESADGLLAFFEHEQYTVVRILETHAHADHLTAARYLQMRLSPDGAPPVPIGIHRGIRTTQAHFGALYDVPDAELERAFDELYDEGDKLEVGELKGEVWHLPGHTQCSAGFVFGESVFTGDSVLLPPTGTARADFPSGSASALYASASRLLSLPPHYRLFSGHSYPQSGASNVCSATVAQQRELNPHVKSGTGEDDFVRMRSERDKGLAEPRLLHQSLQVNIRGGRLPRGSNGEAYLRLPLRAPNGL
ncbi:hypothetical protein Rhopal_007833-T1 [Rhodotorula paludigena]|uniref:Metallo-beta-lactamase domain-containing protein n=1 Tax=Rhodotorula paludigena TaxID=86838 RepID=A0AAV5GQ75_9BASI|nr:hypothetical protein Rhopal_007833-T1 [Rhodotorula paludigena]